MVEPLRVVKDDVSQVMGPSHQISMNLDCAVCALEASIIKCDV